MNIVPTKQTREIAARMARTACYESGADAVKEHWDEVEGLPYDQLPALFGALLAKAYPNPKVRGQKEAAAPGACRACERSIRIKSRGLCYTCYGKATRAGTLDQYPITAGGRGKPWSETIADWRALEAQGYSRTEAAARMGMAKNTLEKAIAGHKRRSRAAA